jgi:phage tail tape-measure protein
MKRVPAAAPASGGSFSRPPSPRIASVIRKDFAYGWYRQVGWNWMNSMFEHAAAGAPGHRDAVAGGGVRIGGVQVDLAGAAGASTVCSASKVSTLPLRSSCTYRP